jgi:thiol-disulfide isomerase/thioredoxin
VASFHDGASCDDGNDCGVGDVCLEGLCLAGPEVPCEDGNPCTINSCLDGQGCAVTFRNGEACDDGDPCTADDVCNGVFCEGSPLVCLGNSECDATTGTCTCAQPCQGFTCGLDACGNPCGDCLGGASCEAGACVFHYPDPPYGTFQGDTLPDFSFTDPSSGQTVSLSQFQGQGRLLLLVFTAGWCYVCKKDAALFNSWLSDPSKSELRILEVYYEDYNMLPSTPQTALAWKNALGIQYPLVIDSATVGPDGQAAGGNLAQLQQPLGPLDPGYYPPVVLICPRDLRILHIRTGFPQDTLIPMINQWLAVEDCSSL